MGRNGMLGQGKKPSGLTGAHALQHFGAPIRARDGVNKLVHIGAKVVGALCRHLCGTDRGCPVAVTADGRALAPAFSHSLRSVPTAVEFSARQWAKRRRGMRVRSVGADGAGGVGQ